MLVRIVAAVALVVVPMFAASAQDSAPRFINPLGLVRPNGYTHVVVAADGRTVYVAGQVAFDSAGALVGPGDFRAQAERVFANLKLALASVGASPGDILKTTTYITDLKNVAVLREIRGRYFNAAHPPANTLVPVASLARPDLLLEVEAVAELPSAKR
jgi:enamine deaminase RidA (YjgF/YER057c/UK114 family)